MALVLIKTLLHFSGCPGSIQDAGHLRQTRRDVSHQVGAQCHQTDNNPQVQKQRYQDVFAANHRLRGPASTFYHKHLQVHFKHLHIYNKN